MDPGGQEASGREAAGSGGAEVKWGSPEAPPGAWTREDPEGAGGGLEA